MAKRKTEWRAWAVCCEGVGPISGCVFLSKAGARIAKAHRFEGLDLYRVKRVRIVLDEEKRRVR